MKGGLLIVGAGIYGVLTKEIAESLGNFDKIAFVDDMAKTAPDGQSVLCTFSEIEKYSNEYKYVVVAIGNGKVRGEYLERIEKDTSLEIVSIVSDRAYVSKSAEISKGCIIEPMATIHTGCIINTGCIISAGAVVNHLAVCEKCSHIDCNATVSGYVTVPEFTKVKSGQVQI